MNWTLWLYFGFLALLALLRLSELRVSARNWASHRDRAELLPERLFPGMVALHLAFFVLVPLELLWLRPVFGGPISWIAVSLTAAALCLRFWTIASMGRSWNVRVVYGDGYPIVDTGPYRWIRHPNYLAVVLELAFIPLIFKLYISAVTLTLANALILRFRIANEEAVLFRNPAWRERMAHKPRFFPFLK